jgi:hypothetical protein
MIQGYNRIISILKEQGTMAQRLQAIKERDAGNEEAAQRWEQCTVLKEVDLKDDVPTPMQMLAYLQTPRGIEFAVKTGLPTHDMLDQYIGNHLQQGVITHGKGFTLCNPRNEGGRNIFIVAGKETEVRILLTEPVHPSPVIVALHGATVHVEARGFAVCRAIRDKKSRIMVTTTDKAIVLQ